MKGAALATPRLASSSLSLCTSCFAARSAQFSPQRGLLHNRCLCPACVPCSLSGFLSCALRGDAARILRLSVSWLFLLQSCYGIRSSLVRLTLFE